MKKKLLAKLLRKLIRGYQIFISPLIPARCRYYPTCSNYGLQAVEWHGARRGGWMVFKRICSCHPLGGHGVDFVPLPLYQFQFTYCEKLNCALSRQEQAAGNINYQYVCQSVHQSTIYQSKTDYNHQLNLWLKNKKVS